MITVSTVSPLEARAAAEILEDSLPKAMGYEVYLRGQLLRSREASPDLIAGRTRPAPAPEVRGASIPDR